MKPGTRVVIKSPKHPWNSYSGFVTNDPKLPTGQIVVELDNGMGAAAMPAELEVQK